MHGQIHDCLKMMILELFGNEIWEKVLEKAGAKESEDFLKYRHYEDCFTIHLIKATSDVLELPYEKTLHAYGDYFCKYAMNLGYDRLLRSLGYDFLSFLENLDTVHTLLAVSYNNIIPPIFRAERVDENTVNLHYYSIRMGLEWIVVGLLEGAARHLYDCEVATKILSTEHYHTENWKVQNHAVIQMHVIRRGVKFKSSVLDGDVTTDITARRLPINEKDGDNSPESLNLDGCPMSPDGQLKNFGVPKIPVDQFRDIFPFHMVFDSQLIIKQVGSGLAGLCSTIKPGECFGHVCDIMHPRMPFTYEEMQKFHKATFVFGVKRFQGHRTLPLKGQLMQLDEGHIIFLCSPKLRTLDEMEQTDIYICDFPIFDTSREFMQLNQLRQAEVNISSKLEETTTALEIMARDLESEKAKTDLLLHQMLPPKVANQLREGKRVEAEKYPEVTILFSDIVTFTNISAAVTPMDVVDMLNTLFSHFDQLANKHNVYKVETIGDAYMVASGVPDVNSAHAQVTVDMGLDMILASLRVKSPATGRPLQIRVGTHSGAVVAGVVGAIMPRYCLFGDTVNTASRMESHGTPGMLHISPTTHRAMEGLGYNIVRRGQIHVKGKGDMTTYFVLGNDTHPNMIELTDEIKELIRQDDYDCESIVSFAESEVRSHISNADDNKSASKKSMTSIYDLHSNGINNKAPPSGLIVQLTPKNNGLKSVSIVTLGKQEVNNGSDAHNIDKQESNGGHVAYNKESSLQKTSVDKKLWEREATPKSQYCIIV